MLNHFVFLFLGLFGLAWGADWLVRGASKLGRAFGISPLVIGLTVVAFGTSAPELMVSINSVLLGKFDIATGNVIGSNIFNIAFILGLCAIIAPIKVEQKLVRFDVPFMIFISVLFYLFSLDLKISRIEGAVFFCGMLFYNWICFRTCQTEAPEIVNEFDKEFGGDIRELRKPDNILRDIFFILAGLALLVIGAQWLVSSSVEIARYFGVSELVIALTIVAAGTSLPEVATSVVATIKGEREIAIGNIIGSNISNILVILGISALIPSKGLLINPASMKLDIPFMLFVIILCYPVFRWKAAISRWEGLLFFSLYLGYTCYIIRQSVH
ncbi:MAG: calcium/sodium antiporter [Candidatus Omnitrophota bacterium]